MVFMSLIELIQIVCFRLSPSFLIFILTSMPSFWLLEMRRVAQRRLATSANTNGTNTAFFDEFALRMGNDELDPTQTLPYNVLMKTVENQILLKHNIFFLNFV